MNNRIQWADNAKALGMFLVFWGHLLERGAFTGQSMLVHDIYKAIYAFHMPFFFLLAGYFFRSRDLRFGVLLVQKFKARLVPVIFFVGVSTLMWQVPTWWGLPDSADSSLQAREKYMLLFQGKPATNWPCWFLVCLFVVELIASELVPFIKSRLQYVVSIAAVMGLAYWVASDAMLTANRLGFQDQNFWFWQEAMVALGFYLAGHFLGLHLPRLVPDGSRVSQVVLLVSVLGFLALFNRNFADGLGTVNMSGSSHGSWPYFWSTAVIGSLAMMHVSAWLPSGALVRYVGNNTVPLLALNGLMLEFFYVYIWGWCEPFVGGPLVVPVSVLVTLASLLACLPIVWLLNKTVPVLIGQWK